MKKALILLGCFFLSINVSSAQSWKNMFSKKNVSKIASTVGLDLPFEIEGTWSFQGTAVELQTEDICKKAAAQVAAVAVEEKINQQQAKYGIKPGMIKLHFEKDGQVTLQAMDYKFPAKYTLSKDQKTMNVSVGQVLNLDADIRHTLDNSMSILFNADKVVELIKYFNTQTDITSLKAVSQILENYDGLKVGIELQKVK